MVYSDCMIDQPSAPAQGIASSFGNHTVEHSVPTNAEVELSA